MPAIDLDKPLEEKDLKKIEKFAVSERPSFLVEEKYLTIKTKGGELKRLELNTVQRRLLEKIKDIERRGKPVRLWILKARQAGISTLIEAILYANTSQREATNSLVIADDIDGANYLFGMQKLFHEKLYPHLRPQIKHSNEKKLEFEHIHSQVLVDTADNLKAGRKYTFRYCHLCLAGDNLIITKDGYIKKISEIKPGDIVKTHRGKFAKVIGLSKIDMEKEFGTKRMTAVYPYGSLGFPIICTLGHKIFVRNKIVDRNKFRGEWKEAKDIKIGDMLGFPYKAINNGQVEYLELPKKENMRGCKWRDGRIYLTRDIGFVFGLYLAEGCIHNGTTVLLAMHKKEKPILDRVGSIINQWIKSYKISPRSNSKTIVGNYYGVSFAKLILKILGEKDNKHIPENFWSYPREFLKGMIEGYIIGDGCIAKKGWDDIRISSIRPQILIQLRDLLISFRYGYSSLDFRKGGFLYGRNCRDIWTLRIHGKTAYNLRKEFGWPLLERRKRPGKDWKQGVWHYWIPVVKTEEAERDFAYDIILEHNDHSYRTITGCGVHNSEVSFYRDLKALMLGLNPAVPNVPGTMIIGESTANGIGNHFYDEWQEASKGITDWETFFLGWQEVPEYTKPLLNNELYPIEAINFQTAGEREKFLVDEQALKAKYGLTSEQINWRRWAIVNLCDKKVLNFNQEFPDCPETAFISTGDLFFDKEALKRQEIIKPVAVGNIVKEEGVYVLREDAAGLFKIYELPKRDGQYVIGADTAQGLENGDKSAAVVLDKRTNKTVCAYNHNIPPDRFTEDLIRAGHYYNDALIACENQGYGYSVNQDLYKRYGRVYRRIKTKKGFGEQTLELGWNTNRMTRPQMLAQLAEEIAEGSAELNDRDLIQQCWTFINNTDRGEPEAEKGKKDDVVIARAIAGQVRLEQPYKEKVPSRNRIRPKYRGLAGY